MLVISLTSIQPRFADLGPTLERLLVQGADAVWLCLPRKSRRFEACDVPPVPDRVRIIWSDVDYGPATKLIPAARALRGQGARLIYCDDDCIYPTGWAKALSAVDAPVVAVSGFDVARMKRQPEALRGDVDIAQGFGGVALWPDDLDDLALTVPDEAFAVDDIWLSGQFARFGLPIALCSAARDLCVPRALADGLQDAELFGRDRAAANRVCVEALTARFGIWPCAKE
ncbi:hypothetical protein PGB28_06830 [Primorskyibacter aestuariivivens]|uniref:hypothetical protein n=1 Tax=Primorskyibacter aestuariivivens TaxID=1888912 RepID=UPI0022FFCE10|nr:hypothetical protein [Primorskyibacter aestuariivivens]MDA7428166.1 hypothetical protein [Primorskyibacter aestuariivivens]